jgi:Universal stress protein family
MARLSERRERRPTGLGLVVAACSGALRRLGGGERVHYVERPPDFEELGYRNALVPIFGEDLSAAAISGAARLIGPGGVLYAVYVLPVPRHLPLDAGLEEEEARGRSVLESARIQARREGIRIRTGLIRARHPGAALVEEARRLHSDVIFWSALHAPSGERSLGPTAAHLLGKRPCRVIIETEGPSRSPDRPTAAADRSRRARV